MQDGLLRVTRLFGSRAERLGCEEVYSWWCPLPVNAHSPPFSWLNHSSRLHDACFRELFWWMYAYTNDLVFWILFLYSWSYSHCNHWSCNMVLTFFLMPIKFWNNTWLLPQMFCHVFIYVFNLPTCEQFWKREASI